jgi:polyketide biosynthesis enoyl-CoA hydratase PksH
MNYETIRVRFDGPICFLQFYRPEANNSINSLMVNECTEILEHCETSATLIVLEGLPDIFCYGADFSGIHDKIRNKEPIGTTPQALYRLWLKLASGPYVTISHVRGKVNAGGIGFVAASDIVIADHTANFSLSELIFGLFPACVMPFLIRRVGFQKAHYMTLMTHSFSANEACQWGLADACEDDSQSLLRKHLLRLRRLPKHGISTYKNYMNTLCNIHLKSESEAINANKMMFSDPRNLDSIFNYVEKGKFPWES